MTAPRPGHRAPASALPDLDALIKAYYSVAPDPAEPKQRVSFGTSGHRGVSTAASFNEAHIVATARAIAEYRAAASVTGPLFLGMDTHALSEPAMRTAVEVFAASGVSVVIQKDMGYTPTPVISHAILSHNRLGGSTADGVVVTPSHNPPDNGGFKYNPPSGGPASGEVTNAIQDRANEILTEGVDTVARIPFERAIKGDTVKQHDFLRPYVADLKNIIGVDTLRHSALRIGADPLGGSGVGYFEAIAETYGLDIEVVNPDVDKTFSFMPLDHDGKIRMDCSSRFAMAGLIGLKDRFDVAFGNDPDFDRHGIVTPAGLMNPNHYLSVAADWLLKTRTAWRADAKIGKTVVTSRMLNRVAGAHGRAVAETPVGFKWFVNGLLDGSYGMGCEESAGASFLRLDGTPWSTDKDGIILDLLAAEITAASGKNPHELYRELTEKFGDPAYERIDAPITDEQKRVFKGLGPDSVAASELAGESIEEVRTTSPEGDAPIGGILVGTRNGWFAARPSGTEPIYKIYAESFLGPDHLKRIQDEAKGLLEEAFKRG